MDAETVVERILTMYETRGRRIYDGAVDQIAHGLQAALLAQRAGAPPTLIVATLLHDVGHLLESDARGDRDAKHERLGARFLSPWFPEVVVTPILLHVAAKRYLVATDPTYSAQLSAASRRSLELQGGPLSREDVERFAALLHAEDAIRLRRWDEAAKVDGAPVPPLRDFAALIRDVMVQEGLR